MFVCVGRQVTTYNFLICNIICGSSILCNCHKQQQILKPQLETCLSGDSNFPLLCMRMKAPQVLICDYKRILNRQIHKYKIHNQQESATHTHTHTSYVVELFTFKSVYSNKEISYSDQSCIFLHACNRKAVQNHKNEISHLFLLSFSLFQNHNYILEHEYLQKIASLSEQYIRNKFDPKGYHCNSHIA